MTNFRIGRVVLFVLAAVALSGLAPAWAQAPTGGISGTVTDASGAVIPGAQIVITEVSTGRTIHAVSNSAGLYVIDALLPSVYNISIAAKGFAPATLNSITVSAGQIFNGSVKLKVGTQAEKVEVSAAALQVDTVRQTVDDVVHTNTINAMPLEQRNFLDTAALLPGVNVRDGGTIDPTKSNAYRTVGVDGRSGTSTRIQVDGIDITDETVGTTTANIPQDSVSEFQLTRSSLDMSTSLTSSGAVSILGKTGTNDLHGDGFYQYRNQSMGARQGFDCSAAADCPQGYANAFPFHRAQTGGSLGGALVKDKIFLTGSYEHDAQATESVVNPSGLTAIDYPQFAGKAAQLPSPINLFTTRLDWNLTPALRAFYRFNYDDDLSTGGDVLSPFQNVDWTNLNIWGLDYARGNLTHSIRAGYLKFHNRIVSQELTIPFDRVTGVPVQINASNLSWGPNGLAPQRTDQVDKQFKYDGSWLVGRHNIRFGFEENDINLGGFANFAGPLAVSDDGTTNTIGGPFSDPMNHIFNSFSMGPNSGYFTVAPGLGLPHGGHQNWRTAFYIGDSFHATSNLTVNFGTRWEYDSGFFNNEQGITRPGFLDYFQAGASQHPKMPYTKFGPQAGFAWDVTGSGKTVIRAGAYMAYDMNIYNNLIFDQYQLIPPGIGPDSYDQTSVLSLGSDGQLHPVAVAAAETFGCTAAQVQAGDYSCLVGQRIGDVLPVIAQIDQAMLSGYNTNSSKFSASNGASLIEQTNGGPLFGAVVPGNNLHVPYSIQMNIGFQHQFNANTMLTVDYIRLKGVGEPFIDQEMEHRRWASTFNLNAAEAQIAADAAAFDSKQGAPCANAGAGAATPLAAAQQQIACMMAPPGGAPAAANIGAFRMANDSVFQGRTPDPNSTGITQTTNFSRVRFLENGFSLYSGLQARLVGRVATPHLDGFERALGYSISWAWSKDQSSTGCQRIEFICGPWNDFNPTDRNSFGYTALDHTHWINAGVQFTTFGGVETNWLMSVHSPSPSTIGLPQLNNVGASSNRLFTLDILGDGGSGSGAPTGYFIPGIGVGGFDRKVKNWNDVNAAIQSFNAAYAGKLTPAGQQLVNAGLFTAAQMAALGATVQPVPLAVTTNPWPMQWYYNADVRVERPFHPGTEHMTVAPFLDIFNVLNHTGFGGYFGSGSTGPFTSAPGGWLRDYNNPAQAVDLNGIRGRQGRSDGTDNRLLQIGVRVTW